MVAGLRMRIPSSSPLKRVALGGGSGRALHGIGSHATSWSLVGHHGELDNGQIDCLGSRIGQPTRQLDRRELGGPWDVHFAAFEREPIASARRAAKEEA